MNSGYPKQISFDDYKELAFFPTLGQSNIYNLTTLPSSVQRDSTATTSSRKHDILTACLMPSFECSSNKQRCNMYSFNIEADYLRLYSKNIDFVYLPVSDIVCLNAFHNDRTDEFFIGVGFIKDEGQSFFNIYASSTHEKVHECCICLSELASVPLQTTHTFYISPSTGQLQWAFLLACGNPCPSSNADSPEAHIAAAVQVYAQLCDSTEVFPPEPIPSELPSYGDVSSEVISGPHSHDSADSLPRTTNRVNTVYGELDYQSANNLFPELRCLPNSTVTYMDFITLKTDPPIRLSAFGCIDGWVGVVLVDMSKPAVKQFFSCTHDSAIVSLKLFTQSPPKLSVKDLGSEAHGLPHDYSLLVCSGLETAVVYRNVYRNQGLVLANQVLLPHSADFDHVNCACVGDLDFDGKPEIVVGTFGQQLLFYRWCESVDSSEELVNVKPTNTTLSQEPMRSGHYELVHRRKVVGQMHGLLFGPDFLGDGSSCLVCLTSMGLHVLQYSIPDALDLLESRLNCLPANFAIPLH